MKLLSFNVKHYAKVTQVIMQAQQHTSDPYITFIFTETKMSIVGGSTNNLITFTFDNSDQIPPSQWSINASAFTNFWNHQQGRIKDMEPINLELRYEQNKHYPILEGMTENYSFRYVQAQEAYDVHIHFFESLKSKNYFQVETNQVKALCKLADEYTPYDVFEVDKNTHKVRIERDNDKLSYDFPSKVNVDFSLAMTQSAKNGLEQLANQTTDSTLSIDSNDEDIIFSDGHQTVSFSLAALHHYREMQPKNFTTKSKMIIDIFTFKQELKNFKKIDKIKNANQALLYITPTIVYLASIHPVTGSIFTLTTKEIESSTSTLYSINLSALSKINIKDITGASAVKMTVQSNEQGELKLAFHNDKDNEYSYDSVPMELALSLLPELMQRVKRAKELDNSHFGEQLDMLGFEDV